MNNMLIAAKAAKLEISQLTTQQKNKALNAMADALLAHQDAILAANKVDMEQASASISSVMLDRLKLTPERIAGMAKGIRDVAELPDPVGKILDTYIRNDGLNIQKVSSPSALLLSFMRAVPM
jgi:glutamate-5-semialdehyde dehydrogenase